MTVLELAEKARALAKELKAELDDGRKPGTKANWTAWQLLSDADRYLYSAALFLNESEQD